MTTSSFPCFKCNGKGNIRGFEHIADGVCFQCSGSGQLSLHQKGKVDADRTSRLAADQRRIDAHDARLARACGLTLIEFRRIAHGKAA